MRRCRLGRHVERFFDVIDVLPYAEVPHEAVVENKLMMRRLSARCGRLALVANPGPSATLKHFNALSRALTSSHGLLRNCEGFALSVHDEGKSHALNVYSVTNDQQTSVVPVVVTAAEERRQQLREATQTLSISLQVAQGEAGVVPFNPGDDEGEFATFDGQCSADTVLLGAEVADFMVPPGAFLGHIAVLESEVLANVTGQTTPVLPADTYALTWGEALVPAWQRIYRAPDMNR